MTLREAAREIEAIVVGIRATAEQLDGPDTDRWAIARDLRSTAHKLDAEAAWAERAGIKAGEPDPALPVVAAPGELVALYGR